MEASGAGAEPVWEPVEAGVTSIVWVTGPSSPGLLMRIEIETFTGAAGGAGAVGVVGVSGVVGVVVAGVDGTTTGVEACVSGVAGAGGVSECAGTAKKVAESADAALPARAMRFQRPTTGRIERSSPLSFQ